MKRDPTGHATKSLLCLFTTTVALTMFHLISSRIKIMLQQEYVKYILNSIIYIILKRFIDIYNYNHH